MNYDDMPFKCSCGRGFPTRGPLTYHRRTCTGSQKRLAGVLQTSKDIFSARKKRRVDALAAALTMQDIASGTNSMDSETEDIPDLDLDITLNIESNPPLADLDVQAVQDSHLAPVVRPAYPPRSFC